MNILKQGSMVMVLALGAVGVAAAHHSAASQADGNKTLPFTGVLEKYNISNPHSYLYFVRVVDGKEQHWVFETGAPAALHRLGLSARDAWKIGDSYRLAYAPAFDGTYSGLLTAIKLHDGRIIGVNPEGNLDRAKKLLSQEDSQQTSQQ